MKAKVTIDIVVPDGGERDEFVDWITHHFSSRFKELTLPNHLAGQDPKKYITRLRVVAYATSPPNSFGHSANGIRKRKRIDSEYKLLDSIGKIGAFSSLKQIIELINQEFGPDALSKKAIQNRLAELSKEGLIKNAYDKESKIFIYGLSEWFDGSKPKSEFMP